MTSSFGRVNLQPGGTQAAATSSAKKRISKYSAVPMEETIYDHIPLFTATPSDVVSYAAKRTQFYESEISDTAETILNFDFQFQSIWDYSDLAARYSFFRIVAVEVIYFPCITMKTSTGTSYNWPNNLLVTAATEDPTFIPLTLDAVRSMQTHKVRNANKPYREFFKPYWDDYEGMHVAEWVNTGTLDNRWGAYNMAFPATGATSAVCNVRIAFTLYLEFKCPKTL